MNKTGKSKLILIVFALITLLVLTPVMAASDTVTSPVILDNGLLRFGTGTENSINQSGNLQQPFYYNTGTARKLTFSNYPLDFEIREGGDGTNWWNINGSSSYNPTLQNQTFDYSLYTQTANGGYGSIRTSGTFSVNGKTIEMTTTYNLPENKSLISVTSTFKNVSNQPMTNLRYWVGTRDDYISNSDSNNKTKGNLIDGVFSQITNSSEQSKALRIDNGAEAVFFFTNSDKANNIIGSSYGWHNIINRDPINSPITIFGDNSYAFYVRFDDLQPGESENINWYYAAGATADIESIVQDLYNSVQPVQNVTNSSMQFTVNSQLAATAYYIVVPSNEVAPTSTNIIDGLSSGGGVPTAHGSVELAAMGSETITVENLTAGTNYRVYVVFVYSNNTEQTADPLEFETTNQYNIYFDSNGGSAVDSLTYSFGDSIVLPTNPTRVLFRFNGWLPELPQTMPEENLTTTAQWTPAIITADQASNITSSHFTANWQPVFDAASYCLDLSTSSDFSSFKIENLNVGNSSSRIVTNLTPGTTYYYRVRAVAGEITSENSNAIAATTLKEAQSIDFNSTDTVVYGAEAYSPEAEATSGLPLTFSSSNANVAVIENGEIKITGTGTTTITAIQSGNQTYLPSQATQLLTISAKPITVTAADKSKVYGADDPALTWAIQSGSLAYTDTISDVFSGTLSRAAGNNVGTYTIGQGSLVANSNYSMTFMPANLTINPKPITVTAADKNKVYGTDDPALTWAIQSGSLAYTDTISDVFSGTLSRAAGSNVGTYTIGQGSLVANSNYSMTFVPANLTINPKPITVTAAAKTKVYGSADPSLTWTIPDGSLAYEDTIGDVFSGTLSRAAGSNVGTYTIGQGSLVANSNYSMTFVPANLTINPKPITVTAAAKTKVYGSADPSLTWTIPDGSLAYEDTIGDVFSGTLSRAAGNNVGTYTIGQGSLAANSNYSLTFVPANLTISAKPITVTADAKTKVYGTDDPALTWAIQSGSLAYTDTISDVFSGTLSRAAGSNVGTYTIGQGSLAANSNYSLTFVPANLTISAKPITVTAADRNKVYGTDDPALTWTIPSGSLAYEETISDVFSGTLSRAAGNNVGTYTIGQGSLVANSNYSMTFMPANLTINPKPITVTAADKNKVYGSADPSLTWTIPDGSLAYEDTIGDVFSGTLSRAAGNNVGTYTIGQGSLAANSNYSLTFVPANLTISAKPITVTADAKTKAYGTDDPALTWTIPSGSLAYEDTISDVFSGTLCRAAGNNVGTYTIGQGSLVANSNYSLTFVPANLTINPKPITVSAAAKSKVYGTDDPALTWTIPSGSLAYEETIGDVFSGTLSRAAGNNVGTYAIGQGSLAANSNYSLTFVPANLTINPKPITVTADAKNKVYGQSDPILTWTLPSGSLAYLDTANSVIIGALTRAQGETVGSYQINIGTLKTNSNYILTYIPANFVISREVRQTTENEQSGVKAEDILGSVLIPELEDEDVELVNFILEVEEQNLAEQASSSFIITAREKLNVEDKLLLQSFDISLIKNIIKNDGTSTTTKVDNNEITGEITVLLPLPTQFANYNNLQVIYIDDEGEITPFDTELVERDGKQYLQFKTSHFSVYAIVGDAPDALPKTGETENTSSLIILSALIVLAELLRQYFMRKTRKTNIT